jgi:hypothetical protein
MTTNSIAGHLFYIPTNRAVAASLRAYVSDVECLRANSNKPVYYALVESVDGSAQAMNAQEIKRLREQASVDIIHFTTARQQQYVNQVIEQAGFTGSTAQRLQTLLLPSKIAYGAGPNKAALLATGLGVNVLHRRDSDTEPQSYESKALYPSEIEGKLLGHKLSEFANEIANSTTVDSSSMIYFVASDYQGDLPVDRLELAELSLDLLIEYERLDNPSASFAELEEGVRSYYLERNLVPYERDEFQVDTTGQTELGVSSVYRLFCDLPEMPITETLGCDYMQKNLLYRLNWPVIYHNRRAVHHYSADRDTRNNAAEYIRYNLMDARYKLLWCIWKRHNRNIEEHLQQLLSTETQTIINAYWYAQSFEVAANSTSREELMTILSGVAAINVKAAELSHEPDGKYAKLADILSSKAETLVDEVLQGISDYTFLIRNWRKLILSAQAIGYSSVEVDLS